MSIDHDVLQLVFVTEKLQSALRNGAELSPEEVKLVEQCAIDLLESLRTPAPPVTHSNGTPE